MDYIKENFITFYRFHLLSNNKLVRVNMKKVIVIFDILNNNSRLVFHNKLELEIVESPEQIEKIIGQYGH